MIAYEKIILIIWNDMYRKEVDDFVQVQRAIVDDSLAFNMLQLSYEVQKLNQVYTNEFPKEVTSMILFNADILAKEFLPVYMKQIRSKLIDIAKKSIVQEKPLKGVTYGTSIVDLFSAADQFFEVVKNLEFASETLLQSYEDVRK